jgi:hypothetical protein
MKTIYFGEKYTLLVKEGADISIYQSSDVKDWGTPLPVSGLPGDLVISGIHTNGVYLYGYTKTGELYHSDNASAWTPVTTVEYPVQSILGFLYKDQMNESGLSFIVEKENKKVFAFTSDLQEWKYSETKAPDDFPLSDFSIINDSLHTQKMSLIAGVNSHAVPLATVWSTENGLYWAKQSEGKFPVLEGANAFSYDNEFYLMNGKLSDGSYNRDIYYSRDKGITWQIKPEKCLPPENYPFRQNASLIVDKDGKYFYIIGGQTEKGLSDIWQGFLNKKTFAN